jgi:RNA polymerase sigma-70 factor, ECF subfamily
MADQPTAQELTALLHRAQRGDDEERNRLFEAVLSQLKRIAAQQMRGERPGHTLQPTALVNEAYVRLFGAGNSISWQGRGHFYAIAAKQMRQILVDHARKKKAEKRGSGAIQVTLSHAQGVFQSNPDYEELEQALQELEAKAPDVAKVIELKFYAGLGDKEVALALNVSFASVRRDWEFGKAFLLHRLERV